MLTKAEQREAKKYANGDWAVLRHCSVTEITTWMRRDGDVITFRETQPQAYQILEENKHLANGWTGWAGKKHGAVVSRIPIVTWNKMMQQCGYDGAEYDKDKLKSMLNDGEYAALRTGGGKL
jgi:hypothetical protein